MLLQEIDSFGVTGDFAELIRKSRATPPPGCFWQRVRSRNKRNGLREIVN